MCLSPIVSAAETASLSQSFGEQGGKPHCPTSGCNSLTVQCTINTSPRSPCPQLPAVSLSVIPQLLLTMSANVLAVAWIKIPQHYFSELTRSLNVDWGQEGTLFSSVIRMISFHHPPVLLSHCAVEPVKGCIMLCMMREAIEVFLSLWHLFGVFTVWQFYCGMKPDLWEVHIISLESELGHSSSIKADVFKLILTALHLFVSHFTQIEHQKGQWILSDPPGCHLYETAPYSRTISPQCI